MTQFSQVTHETYGKGIVLHDMRENGHPHITVRFEGVTVTFYDEQINEIKEVKE
jgi:pterin-4a-carbinolamine dehydratase